MNGVSQLLGGLTPARFVKVHWQKRPLVIRQAIPGFAGILGRDRLFDLAARSDAVSRLVLEHPRRRRERWEIHDGPFPDLDREKLPPTHWTLLVHGIENLIPGGWELLQRFSFLPAARIDDLMISTAAPGGSVGPHEDRYDVFLLQGPGRRRWQLSSRGDHRVLADTPGNILRNFSPEQEVVLEPGDMLYLPPGVAHFGVALDACMTYSIGFVAPSHDALVQNFVAALGQRMQARIDPEAIYADPDLVLQKDPVALGDQMVDRALQLLETLRWDRTDVEVFLGRLLTGPKPHVVFRAPRRPLAPAAFARWLKKPGELRLALPTRGLVRGRRAFVNGEVHAVDAETRRVLGQLFAARVTRLPITLGARAVALLHGLHARGFVLVNDRRGAMG